MTNAPTIRAFDAQMLQAKQYTSYETLEEIDHDIAAIETCVTAPLTVRQTLQAELQELSDPNHPRVRELMSFIGIEGAASGYERKVRETRGHDLREAIGQLNGGISRNDGVIQELTPFVGMAGIDACERTLAHLRELREQFIDESRYPPHARGRFRFLRGKYYENANGAVRRVEVGEIITLTNALARSMGTMVERVPDDTLLTEAPAPPIEVTS